MDPGFFTIIIIKIFRGFAHIYQIIDVPDFNGYGETTPSPYFYQVLELIHNEFFKLRQFWLEFG